MIFGRFLPILVLTGLSAGALASGPIGTLVAEGQFEIRAPGETRAVKFRQDEYTYYSGETIRAVGGPAVLNLQGGGGLGFEDGSEATVRVADDGTIEATLVSGALLYAFPSRQHRFMVQVGNFTMRGHASEPTRLDVERGASSVGTIQRLDDGNVKTMVRDGSLFITNGESVRYQVDAGETVGLLDLPEQTIRTQSGSISPGGGAPLILIQSPEQVGTREEFLVRWQAFDPVDGDYIVIAEEGSEPDEFEAVISSDEGNLVEFEAPGSPGDYEIRFIDGETGEVKRFVYLDVVENVVGGYWWDSRVVAGTIGVAGAGTAVFIGREIFDGDDEPASVSP